MIKNSKKYCFIMISKYVKNYDEKLIISEMISV